MAGATDPYYGAARGLDDLLQRAADLAAQLQRSGPEGVESPRMASELTSVLAAADEDMGMIEESVAAVSEAPQQFGVTDDELASRRAFVEAMAAKLSNIRKAHAQSAQSPQPAQPLRSPQAPQPQRPSNEAQGMEQMMAEREQELAMQEEELRELGQAVTRIKDVGVTIGDEIDRQDVLLTRMSDKMDKVTNKLKQTNKRIDKIVDKMSTTKQYALVICLAVVLLILVVLKLT